MKPKIIVVPDVHGRTFWKDTEPYAGKVPIIFLGDYLDPYYEYTVVSKMTQESVIQNFEEIIALKKAYPEMVTLLLGNHDCEYMYGLSVCNDRCDKANYERIRSLFRDNKDCFQLAAECRIAGKQYVFSHAGMHMRWLDSHVEGWMPENMVIRINDMNAEALAAPDPEQTDFANALSQRDKFRSGKNAVGSPVWADAESFMAEYLLADIIQVVGHTRTAYMQPGITSSAFFLDCGKIFLISNGGKIYDKNGRRLTNKENPFNPPAEKGYESRHLDLDLFDRPFCRKCGSRDIYIKAGMCADHWYCLDCGADEIK